MPSPAALRLFLLFVNPEDSLTGALGRGGLSGRNGSSLSSAKRSSRSSRSDTPRGAALLVAMLDDGFAFDDIHGGVDEIEETRRDSSPNYCLI